MHLRPDRLPLRLVVILTALAGHAVLARAQPPPGGSRLDLPAFISEIDAMARTIEGARIADVPRIAAMIPRTYYVRAGRQEFDVPFEPLARRLAAAGASGSTWVSRRQEVLDDLRLVRDEAAALERGPASPSDARGALSTILSRREFASARRSEWRAEIRRRITAWLEAIWQRFGGDRMNSRTAAFALACCAILIGTGALALWLIGRSAPRLSRVQSRLEESGPPRSSRAWALEAIAAARAGRTRDAARCSYRAALRRLEEQGIWRIDESRTAREYLQALESGDPGRDSFRGLVRRFELAWYDNRPLTSDDLHAIADSLERLGCLHAHERVI